MENILKSQGFNYYNYFCFLWWVQYWALSQAIDAAQYWMGQWSVLLHQFLIVYCSGTDFCNNIDA